MVDHATERFKADGLGLIFGVLSNDRSATVHIGDASLTFWFNPALTLDAPSGTHLVWAPSASCASGAASCFVAPPTRSAAAQPASAVNAATAAEDDSNAPVSSENETGAAACALRPVCGT